MYCMTVILWEWRDKNQIITLKNHTAIVYNDGYWLEMHIKELLGWQKSKS